MISCSFHCQKRDTLEVDKWQGASRGERGPPLIVLSARLSFLVVVINKKQKDEEKGELDYQLAERGSIYTI